jgi:hypothetical protein
VLAVNLETLERLDPKRRPSSSTRSGLRGQDVGRRQDASARRQLQHRHAACTMASSPSRPCGREAREAETTRSSSRARTGRLGEALRGRMTPGVERHGRQGARTESTDAVATARSAGLSHANACRRSPPLCRGRRDRRRRAVAGRAITICVDSPCGSRSLTVAAPTSSRLCPGDRERLGFFHGDSALAHPHRYVYVRVKSRIRAALDLISLASLRFRRARRLARLGVLRQSYVSGSRSSLSAIETLSSCRRPCGSGLSCFSSRSRSCCWPARSSP